MVLTWAHKLFAAVSRPFRGANITPQNSDWQPVAMTPDEAIRQSQPLLGNRSRDSQRNDPAFIAAEEALVSNVIQGGIGITPAVIIGNEWDEDAADDEAFNDEAATRFQMWCDTEFEAYGAYPFWMAQQIGIREVAAQGEFFLIRSVNTDPQRICPLQYQLMSADMLAQYDLFGSARGRGVFDRGILYHEETGQPISYFFARNNRNELLFGQRDVIEVPADRVIHFFIPQIPGQSRGAGYLSATLQNSTDRDWLVGNVLTAAAVQAMFTLVHKTNNPMTRGLGAAMASTSSTGKPTVRLGKGIVSTIGIDEEVTPVQSTQPGPSLDGFIRLLMQLQAMGSRMSYLALTRDYSQTNYSSAKAAIEADKRSFTTLQMLFGAKLVQPIYAAFLDATAGAGLFESVSAKVYWSSRRRWQRAELTLPGFAQLDELKEASAAIARMGSLQSTLRDELVRRGLPATAWRRLILQKERETRLIREASERAGAPIASDAVSMFVGKSLSEPAQSQQTPAQGFDGQVL